MWFFSLFLKRKWGNSIFWSSSPICCHEEDKDLGSHFSEDAQRAVNKCGFWKIRGKTAVSVLYIYKKTRETNEGVPASRSSCCGDIRLGRRSTRPPSSASQDEPARGDGSLLRSPCSPHYMRVQLRNPFLHSRHRIAPGICATLHQDLQPAVRRKQYIFKNSYVF